MDFDVDLPNWFAEIKKACDANGVIFGVDIESFKECWCPKITMRTKPWSELEEQLRVAGMFTDHITISVGLPLSRERTLMKVIRGILKENDLLLMQ